MSNYVYFNTKLRYDATKFDYKAECLKVIEGNPRKILYFLDGLQDTEVDWMSLYSVTRTAIEKKESEFTYYVFNGKKALKCVATVTIYLKDLSLINPKMPLLKSTKEVGHDLYRKMFQKQFPSASIDKFDEIGFFLNTTKMTYDQFAKEWNRQANDGDAFMVFRGKDKDYGGLSYKLVINKADFLNSL